MHPALSRLPPELSLRLLGQRSAKLLTSVTLAGSPRGLSFQAACHQGPLQRDPELHECFLTRLEKHLRCWASLGLKA